MRKLLPMLLAIPMWLAACGNYNDDPLRTWVGDLEDRIEALEERCDELNDEIVALRTIVNSIERGTLIESVTPFVEEERSGYRITFTDGTTITIYNGTNGSDGDKGDKGDDGSTPVIGVEEDGGVYYWTIDGEWLTDSEGNRIAAQGPAGEPGAAGTTPQLKIEEGYWWVSTDGGQSWEQLGKATGEGGDSLFQSVTQDETSVTFTLSDGTTITVPKAARLSIELAQTSCRLTGRHAGSRLPYQVDGRRRRGADRGALLGSREGQGRRVGPDGGGDLALHVRSRSDRRIHQGAGLRGRQQPHGHGGPHLRAGRHHRSREL